MTRLLPILLLVCLTGAAPSPPDDTLLKKGVQLYQQQRYEAALETYRKALDSTGPSGALHYNVGSAYFRMGQLGQAIRFYEKAARRLPDHPQVQHNLRIAGQRIDRPVPAMPAPFWQRWWNTLITRLGPSGLFLLGLTLYIPGTALLAYRLWSPGRSRWLAYGTGVLLTVGLAAIGGGLFASWQVSTDQRAVVITEDAKLHRDPAANSTIDRTIPEGTILHVEENLAEWQHVQLPNGAVGWVRRSDVGDI